MPVLIGRVSDEIDLQLGPIACQQVLEAHFDDYWITSVPHQHAMVIHGKTKCDAGVTLHFPMKNGMYYAAAFKLDPEDVKTHAMRSTPWQDCSGEKTTNPQRKLLLL